MTSPQDRRVCVDRFYKAFARQVGLVSSPGLGAWDDAWEIVAVPNESLMDALSEWEATGSEGARREAIAWAGRAVEAWKEADRLYRQRASLAGSVPPR